LRLIARIASQLTFQQYEFIDRNLIFPDFCCFLGLLDKKSSLTKNFLLTILFKTGKLGD